MATITTMGVVMANNRCRCCKNIIRVTTTSIVTDGNTVTLNLPQLALNNGDKIRVCIAQNLPNSVLPLQLQFLNIPILKVIRRCGKAVISDQVRVNRFYDFIIGTDARVAVIINSCDLCCTNYNYPQLLPTTTTTDTPTTPTE